MQKDQDGKTPMIIAAEKQGNDGGNVKILEEYLKTIIRFYIYLNFIISLFILGITLCQIVNA